MIPCSAGVASTSSVTTRVTSHHAPSSRRVAGPASSRRAAPGAWGRSGGTGGASLTTTWCRPGGTGARSGLGVPAPGEVDAPGLQPVHGVDLLAALAADADLEVQVVAGALALA